MTDEEQRRLDEAIYGFSVIGPDGSRVDPKSILAEQLGVHGEASGESSSSPPL